MTFQDLGLRAELVLAVTQKGYTTPSPIQEKSIPHVLAGEDVFGGAQTGTGKTAAFALPILQRLAATPRNSSSRAPRALVLAPTRELAAQIGQSFRDYGEGLKIRSTVIFGGVGFNPQAEQLRRGIDVLVATPGRLLDHANQRTLDLSEIETLVLDEADRMLDMGFIHDIKRILKLLPANRQNLFFSATCPPQVQQLSSTILRQPKQIEVARQSAPADLVTQVIHPVAQTQKRTLLSQLIKEGDWRQVLVFTRTKHGANRLAKQLGEDGLPAAAIHGNKSQSARTKALDDFKKGQVRILVATDIAARGIDIKELPHVVNFDLPNVPEDYVHRIGRTGRAGSGGASCSLVSREERPFLRDIERLLGRPVPVLEMDGFQQETGPLPPKSADPRGPRNNNFGRASRGAAPGQTRQAQGTSYDSRRRSPSRPQAPRRTP
jgi:ATP-dependent RNA helicase RhlE